jgi:hypothetical protein
LSNDQPALSRSPHDASRLTKHALLLPWTIASAEDPAKARSVWSARSLLPLSHGRKAGASSPHFKGWRDRMACDSDS